MMLKSNNENINAMLASLKKAATASCITVQYFIVCLDPQAKKYKSKF